MPEPSSGEVSGRISKRPQESKKRVSRVEQVSSGPVADPEVANHPGESLPGSDFSQATFERHAALLGDSRAARPMHARQRAMFVGMLQRDYGNHYVRRLVDYITKKQTEGAQTKLKVGPAGDKYEREADSVAKQVVRNIGHGPLVETDAASEVGQRDSTGELEAEDVQLEPLDIQRQELTSDEEEDLLQAKPLDIQRQELTSDEEEDLLQAKPLDVQRQVGLEGGLVEPDIESDINAARGRGQSIPDTLRESMESSFGADFGGVRLHSDATSDSLNENLNSRAFTVGQDIFVRRQDAGLTSAEGKELLAHELTHVVQQNGPTVRRDDEKKSGVRAAASWTIDKIEKGVGWVSENIIDKWGNAAKTWLQKKLSAAWAVLRKKYPWIATFLEGVLGVVVNLAQMGWSGLKLIARIAWFILKAFGKSILSNIGKVIDIGWKFLSGKSWEEVDLFGDTRAWFKDWNEHKKNPMLWAEFLGVWVGNARDTVGWIALISGLLALIPGPQSPVFGAISGVSGIITLVLSGIAAGVSSVDLFSNFIHYANNLSLGLPVEAIEKRMKRLSVLVVGDWSSLIGALIGQSTDVIPNETVKQSTGAIIGGFTEGTGEIATGVV
ncbi:MAG: DUF4157 domain-containing protein, partial [Chloroflexi bacterium]|nr:DUF4157 domain-containing protein [Chloroflexota bacterium]